MRPQTPAMSKQSRWKIPDQEMRGSDYAGPNSLVKFVDAATFHLSRPPRVHEGPALPLAKNTVDWLPTAIHALYESKRQAR